MIRFFASSAALALIVTLHAATPSELVRAGKWSEARPLLEQLTVAEPENADSWRDLGRARLESHDAPGAIDAFEKATALTPTSSVNQRWLGDAYGEAAAKGGALSQLANARKSRAAYERAIELDPRNVDAHWSLMEYCRQAPEMAGGGKPLAYAQAEEIAKIDAALGQVALASLYVTDRKGVEAFGLFDEALPTKPNDYLVQYHYGRLCAMTGQRFDAGLAALRHCLTLPRADSQPGPAPIHWRIGQLLQAKGDKPGARAAYEAALAADPDFNPAKEALRKLEPPPADASPR